MQLENLGKQKEVLKNLVKKDDKEYKDYEENTEEVKLPFVN